MKAQRAEIRAHLRHWLGRLVDAPLGDTGFARRSNSLIYSRRIENGVQRIDVSVEHHPVERPNAAAAVYPLYRVSMHEVNTLVREMAGDDAHLAGDLRSTLWGPVEWTSPKGVGARWYVYQPDSVPGVARAARRFLTKYTIPMLDAYRTSADLCDAPLDGDSRVVHQDWEVLRVVAARILTGRVREARELMDARFGRAGPRRRYRPVFEFLDSLAG